MRSLRLLVFIGTMSAALVAGACEPADRYYLVVSTTNGEGASLQTYKAGDTVSFVAVEWVQHPFGGSETTRSSATQPDVFTWSSADTSIATVVSAGRVFLKAAGSVNLAVKTSTASISAPLHIAP
jgi:uncharacterized protein YjdB